MNIYISGISGTGMGPLALIAKAAGFDVCGSDLSKGAIYNELIEAGIDVEIGKQDGEFLSKKIEDVDWFVYTSALPENHPELRMAREAGIKVTKRDELTAYLLEVLGLKMVAVAGTHGKTTTTAMIVWASLKLGLPVSYIVGTTLQFASSGAYHKNDQYFVYEADEYDRNFLKFHPWLAVIPYVSYDHPDIYPTREDYEEAFNQFESQCKKVIKDPSLVKTDSFKLAGEARRKDAALALAAVHEMAPGVEVEKIVEVLNEFPGAGRRFERLADGIYTDYAHHPEEIAATVNVALEQARIDGRDGVVVVYQPHQNTRQHEVRDGYKKAFDGVDKLYFLPTYLTREDPKLEVLTPEDLMQDMEGVGTKESAELNDELFEEILKQRDASKLVILMTAGPADGWLREKLM